MNFKERSGEECLVSNIEGLLARIRAKYLEYGIKEDPYVVVKADAGTYGMGIMTAKSPDDVRGLNRTQRKKMAVVKEGLEVHEVIIQEGVHTYETVNDAAAEPVVYMIDRFVVGGFYRVHTARGKDENLNAPGMQFEPLAVRRLLHRARPRRGAGAHGPTASTPTASWRASRRSPRRSSSKRPRRRAKRRPPREDPAFILDPLASSRPTRTRPTR